MWRLPWVLFPPLQLTAVIMALVTASGPRGLSAFFPPTKRTYTNPGGQASPGQLPVPHLPLTSTWEEGDFSLAAVLASTAAPGKVNLRKYCMTLLSRYFYVSGEHDIDSANDR